MLPVLMLTVIAGVWFHGIQEGGPHVLRNLVPLLILSLLAALTLIRGGGRWTGSGMRLLLGTVGFAIPALGLSSYLHYAYSVNLNDLFSVAEQPERIFRYLPIYTTVSGGIGFAIGWIVGRNA
jgi:hypothetical protein